MICRSHAARPRRCLARGMLAPREAGKEELEEWAGACRTSSVTWSTNYCAWWHAGSSTTPVWLVCTKTGKVDKPGHLEAHRYLSEQQPPIVGRIGL